MVPQSVSAAAPKEETTERQAKIVLPKAPNTYGEGDAKTEFPVKAYLFYADGTSIKVPLRTPKPSKASGAVNCWGGGKMALEDGTMVQVGINLTVVETE